MKDINPKSKLQDGVIYLNYEDNISLYQAYMPFIEGGGLFCPSNAQYTMGQNIFLFLTLPNDAGKYALPGSVAWINPPKTVSKLIPGIGIQFHGRESEKVHDAIKQSLGKMLASDLPNQTM